MPLQHIVDLHRYVLENAHKIVTIAKGCKVVMYLNVPINHWPFIPWDVRLIAIGIYRHHTVNLFADTTIAPPIQGTASEPDPLVVVVAPLAQEIFLDLPVCLSVRPPIHPSLNTTWVIVTARTPRPRCVTLVSEQITNQIRNPIM